MSQVFRSFEANSWTIKRKGSENPAKSSAPVVDQSNLGQAPKSMLTIPFSIVQNMIEHARELAPHECCGILSGKDHTVTEGYRITNILANMSEQELTRFDGAKLSDLKSLSPEERADIAFQMDAREMAMAQRDIRSKGFDLLGFYHSHTFSPARPSQTDITIAMEFESYRAKLNFPEPFHLIISLEHMNDPIVRAYRIRDNRSTEIPVETLP